MTDCVCCDPPWSFVYDKTETPCPDDTCSNDCVPFGEITDCGICAQAPRRYSVDFGSTPCFDCCPNASGVHTLYHDTVCIWVSNEFTCGSDTYRWRLILGATTELSLLRTAGSGTLIEVVYEATAWDCLCVNQMDLVSSSNCSNARNVICVTPQADIFDNCSVGCSSVAQCWEVVIAGFTSVCDCDQLNGTYVLEITSHASSGATKRCYGTIPLAGMSCLPYATSLVVSFDSTGVSASLAAAVPNQIVWRNASPDCFGPNTLSYVSRSGAGIFGAWCEFTSIPATTITIQPIDCP